MRAARTAIALALGLTALIASEFGARADPLEGDMALNTGVVPCNGGMHRYDWVNDELEALNITQIQVLLGLDADKKADIYLHIRRDSDGAWLLTHGSDRYANPGNSLTEIFDFAPNWFVLEPGDSLALFFGCNPVSHGIFASHALVVMNYFRGLP